MLNFSIQGEKRFHLILFFTSLFFFSVFKIQGRIVIGILLIIFFRGVDGNLIKSISKRELEPLTLCDNFKHLYVYYI